MYNLLHIIKENAIIKRVTNMINYFNILKIDINKVLFFNDISILKKPFKYGFHKHQFIKHICTTV